MANEKRLIDANALMKAIRFEHDCIMQDPEISNQMKWRESVCYQRSMRAVEKATIVDAVEVVRCKDCKHFVQGEPYDPCECMKWKVKFGVAYTTPDGYCHKAERKENEGDCM